jgi:hypothetical protein
VHGDERLVEILLRARHADDRRALAREQFHAGPADAGPRTRDDRDLVLDPVAHVQLLFLSATGNAENTEFGERAGDAGATGVPVTAHPTRKNPELLGDLCVLCVLCVLCGQSNL